MSNNNQNQKYIVTIALQEHQLTAVQSFAEETGAELFGIIAADDPRRARLNHIENVNVCRVEAGMPPLAAGD